MDGQFTGKVAIVTGGTQGLGEATARLLAKRGAEGIIICGRHVERGTRVASLLSGIGCKAHFVRADLARMEDCRAVVAKADAEFGRVDVLCNVAAITDRGTILDTTCELFDTMMAINVRAPFFLIQESAKLMIRERIEGAMVNVISMSGHGGQPFISAYSVSKGALQTLTKNAAYSLLRNRIRVNGLNIGWMDTPGEQSIQKRYHDAADDWLRQAESRQPYGRLLKPDEVARAIAFLASAESGMMSGALVDFDQSVLGAWDSAPQPLAAMAL